MTTVLIVALLAVAPPAAKPAPALAPNSTPTSAPAISQDTRPELYRDAPPGRAGDVEPPRETTGSFWISMLLRTVLVLAGIVLLAYLVLNKGLGRLLGKARVGQGRAVQLVDRLSLGPKNAVYVIESEGRRFLVGTGDHSTSLLAELSAPSLPSIRSSLESSPKVPS